MSYLVLNIHGTSPLGEVWQIGATYDPFGPVGAWDQTIGNAQAAAAGAVAIPTNIINTITTGLAITAFQVEQRSSSTEALEGTALYTLPTPAAGGGAVRMPLQCATVVSLRTNTPGPRGRGRIYWPFGSVILDSSLRWPTSAVTPTLADIKTYLKALGTAMQSVPGAGITLSLAVRSRTHHTSAAVTNLQMGNVVDTQRRRRDKSPEVISTLAYP
jgi:hypothetical protein